MPRLSNTTSTVDACNRNSNSGGGVVITTTASTAVAKDDGADGNAGGSCTPPSHSSVSNDPLNDADGQWLRVCDYDSVGDEGMVLGFCNDTYRILVANHDGAVRATDLMCTHADADLSTGFMGPDGVRCPLHLSVFNLKDGNPQNPPAEKPLRVYNVKIDDGQVYVRVS